MCLQIYFLWSVILLGHGGQCNLTWDLYGMLSAKYDTIILDQNIMKKEIKDLVTSMTATHQQVNSLEKRLTEVASLSQQMVAIQERLDNMDSHVTEVAAAEAGRRTNLLRRGLEQEKVAAQSRFEKTMNNTSDLLARVEILDNKHDVLASTVETQSDIISEMQQTSEKTRAQVATVKQEVVTTQRNTQTLQSRDDTFERTLSELKSQTRTIAAQVDTTRGQISRLQHLTGNFVGFSVRLFTRDKKFGKNTTLKFDEVIYNEGSHYSPSTGIFTAPVSGVYVFMCNVAVHNSSSDMSRATHVTLRVNGFVKAEAFVSGVGFLTGGNAAVVKVTAGDRVYVATATHRERYYIWVGFTSFSGALLHMI